LEARAQAAADELQRVTHEAGAIGARTTELERLGGAVVAVDATLAALRERYAIEGRIDRLVNGRDAAAGRITFQRFVLGALLDEVLDAASQRLALMSRNRYLLRRAGDPTDRRRSAGLDLAVDDAFTGRARPVATLSGGESFLAALALALGMMDVVSRHAGGVQLGVMFIDEGFGALDPEALDLALSTLLDLRRQGRMIGVISHVPELRERIDYRLEVGRGRAGSTARLIVP
jgi:exonuclease SbcC